MQNILVVVDMQNDFIDGALGTKEAVAIVPAVKEKIFRFHTVFVEQKVGKFVQSLWTFAKKNLLIK